MSKDALIIGASGSLGGSLVSDFPNSMGTYFRHPIRRAKKLDIRDERSVKNLASRIDPELVLITSAKTNVEECELNPRDSYDVNVLGIRNIMNAFGDKKIVFYSTDVVFDGGKDIYTEEDTPSPINTYGKHKLEAEAIVLENPENLVIRTSRHYGPGESRKYINSIINSLIKGKEVRAPIDTRGNFTFIPDLSRATLKLAQKRCSGIYNVAGGDANSLFEAAVKVAKVFGLNKDLVIPVEKDYFGSNVKRPSCVLSLEKLSNERIGMKSLEEGLNEMRVLY